MKSIGEAAAEKTEYRAGFIDRVFFISHLAAMWHNNTKISFVPSKDIKVKEELTKYSRRFIRSNDNRGCRIFNIPYIRKE